MSSIHTVQSVMGQLDPAEMSGTVLAAMDISRPAVESMQRRWPNSGRGTDLIDLNREFPGNENGPGAPGRHAAMVFNRLLRPNADASLDFHTSTTGIDAPAFHLAKMDVPEAKILAELFPVDQIFNNAGYPGLLSNAFLDAGIPSITPEVGNARVLDMEMIPRFVEGTMNVLKHYGILSGPIGRTAKDTNVFVGNSLFPVLASQGGIVEPLVKLKDKVVPGQKVAIQRNSFGEVVAEYSSGVEGEVGGIRSDATSEPGNVLMFIVFNHAPVEGQRDYPE
jgi:predicted deacylase